MLYRTALRRFFPPFASWGNVPSADDLSLNCPCPVPDCALGPHVLANDNGPGSLRRLGLPGLDGIQQRRRALNCIDAGLY
jgi:hypothetical protein